MKLTPAVSDGAQEQLIAIVAHELRHPLMPIRNAAALLRQDSPDAATIRRAAEIIERQASDMNRLIGDLVEVSRVQQGTLELRRVRAPFSALVEHALEAAGPMVSECERTLYVSVSPQPVYLEMDVLRLGQALQNIIGNACKYTDKHGHIHLRAQREGAQAVISISDTGIGIPDAELETIFGLFVKSERGGGIAPGLGLGLYLARQFIEAHGGTVTAASPGSGRGSVFTVRLPCEVPTEPAFDSVDAATAGDLSPA